MAGIEKESLDKTGLRSDVVTLFQGGQYHLYRFKKYTDVRLVFAPEQQIAFFGGDLDNFEYPRYCLDFCFFLRLRGWEAGQDRALPEVERSRPGGERIGFRVGTSQAGTSRLLTMDELEYKREVQFPNTMEWLYRLEVMLSVYSSQSEENARRAKDFLFGVQNSRKAREVLGTKVKEVEARKRLYKEKPEFFRKSDDPMVKLVLMIDDEARAVRKLIEAQDEIKRQAYGEIAAAQFAIEGASTYPDATFTLRLAFGQAKGYEEDGKEIPYQTEFAGLYERSAEHNYQPPFDLPERWVERKDRLDLSTPFNFVCTADIIGGNSGSPVINKDAEVVGLIFDGNIYSLVLDFIYTDVKARALSVHTRSITEALRKVYDAPKLVEELLGTEGGRR